MLKKPFMPPGTLNTILTTAPMILQGATKLIKMIREREGGDNEATKNIPETIEDLKHELQRLDSRLDANAESSIEQIKLIEELAKQNEALAESLKKTVMRVNLVTSVAVIALLTAMGLLLIVFG